jgi:hypothetical protein
MMFYEEIIESRGSIGFEKSGGICLSLTTSNCNPCRYCFEVTDSFYSASENDLVFGEEPGPGLFMSLAGLPLCIRFCPG